MAQINSAVCKRFMSCSLPDSLLTICWSVIKNIFQIRKHALMPHTDTGSLLILILSEFNRVNTFNFAMTLYGSLLF